jgi:hypothetical protein
LLFGLGIIGQRATTCMMKIEGPICIMAAGNQN